MEKTPEGKENENYQAYDLYPSRRGNYRSPLIEKIYKHTSGAKIQSVCEDRVLRALKNNPVIKILIGALKKAGCPVNLRRHIVCEDCSELVTGGYDTEFNQIVICRNFSTFSKKGPESTLVHELIHMYDSCVGKVDFTNLEHLACTEIRAANIAHCSFMSSFFLGQSSFFNIKKTHQYCVKIKAAQSLMVSRKLDFPTAMEYILKVFDKCYNDLEPVGRRLRRKSGNSLLALKEAEHFQICDKQESSEKNY